MTVLTRLVASAHCKRRQNEKLAVYGDTANARALMLQELSSLAEANPALRDKMVFPQMAMSSLRNLFVQRCADGQTPAHPNECCMFG